MAYPDLSATQPLLSNAAEKPTAVPPPDAWQGPGYGSVGPFSGDLPYQPVATPPYHSVHSQAADSGASSVAHDHYHWDKGAQQRGPGLYYPLGTDGSGASDYGYAGGVTGGPGVVSYYVFVCMYTLWLVAWLVPDLVESTSCELCMLYSLPFVWLIRSCLYRATGTRVLIGVEILVHIVLGRRPGQQER